jgi:hypothetical protein
MRRYERSRAGQGCELMPRVGFVAHQIVAVLSAKRAA